MVEWATATVALLARAGQQYWSTGQTGKRQQGVGPLLEINEPAFCETIDI
jgi:hypothetical protein